MKNASRASCIMGYRIYVKARQRNVSIDRDSLNATLVAHHYDAVSKRTWSNYVEQYRVGVPPEEYRSINRQDYFHTGVPEQFIDRSKPEQDAA